MITQDSQLKKIGRLSLTYKLECVGLSRIPPSLMNAIQRETSNDYHQHQDTQKPSFTTSNYAYDHPPSSSSPSLSFLQTPPRVKFNMDDSQTILDNVERILNTPSPSPLRRSDLDRNVPSSHHVNKSTPTSSPIKKKTKMKIKEPKKLTVPVVSRQSFLKPTESALIRSSTHPSEICTHLNHNHSQSPSVHKRSIKGTSTNQSPASSPLLKRAISSHHNHTHVNTELEPATTNHPNAKSPPFKTVSFHEHLDEPEATESSPIVYTKSSNNYTSSTSTLLETNDDPISSFLAGRGSNGGIYVESPHILNDRVQLDRNYSSSYEDRMQSTIQYPSR